MIGPVHDGCSQQGVRRLAVGSWIGAGGILVLLAGGVRGCLPPDDILGPLAFGLLEAGLFLLLLAILPLLGVRPRVMAGLGLAMVLVLIAVVLSEVVCRQAGWDFRGQEAAWRRLPPFTREARTPTGSVFFRRDGPEAWTGSVIRASLELRGHPVPAVYRDEASMVARYDAQGFRNEDGWVDWEMAVAGDSFTELGFLPFDELFTTRLGRELGRRVRNLGVSGTGPYTQLHYLKEFGVSPSLQQVLILFFEGNDLEDMDHELAAMSRFEATGERPRREFVPQTSLLAAVADVWRRRFAGRRVPPDPPLVDAFRSAEGEVPVHLSEVPPQRRRLPEDATERLDRFVSEYRDWALGRRVEPWLAYLPCKARALHSRIQGEDPRRRNRGPWWPEELPTKVADVCHRHGIQFVDLTPVLDEAVRHRGELVFNPLFEAHLNAKGSQIVADELVRRFRARANAVESRLR